MLKNLLGETYIVIYSEKKMPMDMTYKKSNNVSSMKATENFQ